MFLNKGQAVSSMKTLFVEARCDEKVVLPDNLIKRLPEKIALFTTVQFIGSLGETKKQLQNSNKKILLIKPKHSKYKGQILGCGIERFSYDVDAFLYIGDGLFHPKTMMLKNNKPVFVFNPFSRRFFELDKKEAEAIKKKQKGALLKFLSSKEIGVLVSTKSGQERLKDALKLKERYKNKNFYFFLFNTLDFNELENFPFIECFVNTACPRIALDDENRIRKAVINIEDLRIS